MRRVLFVARTRYSLPLGVTWSRLDSASEAAGTAIAPVRTGADLRQMGQAQEGRHPMARTSTRKTTAKNAGRRLKDFRAGVYMQTLLRDRGAGLMHSMIYFGFLVLLAVTTTLEIDHQLPEDLKFLHGDVYRGYAAVGDVAGVVFVTGVLWAIVRRYVQRVYRIRIKSKPEHALILGEVFDATVIHNALAQHPAEVVVHVDGVAASAGSFIAMAASLQSQISRLREFHAAHADEAPAMLARLREAALEGVRDELPHSLAVVIDAGKAEVFVRQYAQPFEGGDPRQCRSTQQPRPSPADRRQRSQSPL